MQIFSQHRLTFVWVALVALTAANWWLGASFNEQSEHYSQSIAVAAYVIAFAKLRMVIWEFMGARHADRRLRHVLDAWIAASGVLLIFLCWLR